MEVPIQLVGDFRTYPQPTTVCTTLRALINGADRSAYAQFFRSPKEAG